MDTIISAVKSNFRIAQWQLISWFVSHAIKENYGKLDAELLYLHKCLRGTEKSRWQNWDSAWNSCFEFPKSAVLNWKQMNWNRKMLQKRHDHQHDGLKTFYTKKTGLKPAKLNDNQNSLRPRVVYHGLLKCVENSKDPKNENTMIAINYDKLLI